MLRLFWAAFHGNRGDLRKYYEWQHGRSGVSEFDLAESSANITRFLLMALYLGWREKFVMVGVLI